MSPRRRPSVVAAPRFEALDGRRLFATWIVQNTTNEYWHSLQTALRESVSGDIIDCRGITGTISIDQGQFGLTKDLTILGPGSDKLTLTTNSNSRFFEVVPGHTLELRGLTFNNCIGGDDTGAAIKLPGDVDLGSTLKLDDVVFSNNAASTFGGAVWGEFATVTMTRCRFTNNSVSGALEAMGGGLYLNGGSLNATNCTFDSNSASLTAVAEGAYDYYAMGGGVAILNVGDSSFTNCTFVSNAATAARGPDSASTATAIGAGLGVAMDADLTILNCTFANNVAGGTDTDSFGGGLGVFSFGSGSIDGNDVLKVANTILAGNTATVGTDAFGLDVTGSGISNLKNNTVGIADDSGVTVGSTGNRGGSLGSPLDAELGALQNNGGVVPTMMPNAGSPVLGVASGSESPRTDARDYPRSASYDVGAVERQSNYSPGLKVWPDDVAQVDVPFYSPITATDVDGDAITFTLTSGPAWLSLVDNGNGTAALVGTPTLEDAGNSTVVFKATDGTLTWTETMAFKTVYEQVVLSDGGVLRVAGTTGDDVVRVWQPRGTGGAVRVIIGDTMKNYAAGTVTAIQLFGRDGNDLLQATCQDIGAYIQAGDGDDTIVGGEQADSLTAAAGDDVVYGMGGDDWIDGNGGRDALYGGDGNDRAYGGNGRDVIDGGLGNDVLYGEVGPDLFLTADRTRDWIFGGEPDVNFVQTDGIKDILYDASVVAA